LFSDDFIYEDFIGKPLTDTEKKLEELEERAGELARLEMQWWKQVQELEKRVEALERGTRKISYREAEKLDIY
jgi:hypothetical protein